MLSILVLLWSYFMNMWYVPGKGTVWVGKPKLQTGRKSNENQKFLPRFKENPLAILLHDKNGCNLILLSKTAKHYNLIYYTEYLQKVFSALMYLTLLTSYSTTCHKIYKNCRTNLTHHKLLKFQTNPSCRTNEFFLFLWTRIAFLRKLKIMNF